MTIDPGRLDRRLVLEGPVDTADGAGGFFRDYAPVATLWAAVTPRTYDAGLDADAAGATVTHRILVRAGVTITTEHRLRLGARLFRILAVREDPRAFLTIDAEERGP